VVGLITRGRVASEVNVLGAVGIAAVVGAGAGALARIAGPGTAHSRGRGARVATFPHAGAPERVVRGRAATGSGAGRAIAANPSVIIADIAALVSSGLSGDAVADTVHGSGCAAGFAAAGLAAIAMTANSFVICFFFMSHSSCS